MLILSFSRDVVEIIYKQMLQKLNKKQSIASKTNIIFILHYLQTDHKKYRKKLF